MVVKYDDELIRRFCNSSFEIASFIRLVEKTRLKKSKQKVNLPKESKVPSHRHNLRPRPNRSSPKEINIAKEEVKNLGKRRSTNCTNKKPSTRPSASITKIMEVEVEDYDQDVDMASGDSTSTRWRKSKTSKVDANEVEDVTPTTSAAMRKGAKKKNPVLDSDDDDEPEILETSSYKPKVLKNPLHSKKLPEFIDLTKEEDLVVEDQEMTSEMDDSDSVIVEEMPVQSLDDDDLPQLVEIPPLSKMELAEEQRKNGNNHFKVGEYNQALAAYTRAIDYVPTEAAYYGNRSACYMMMKRYQDALLDSQKSLKLDSSYEKGYLRIVRVNLALGDVVACQVAIQQYEGLGSTSTDISSEKKKLVDLKKFIADIQVSTLRKDFRRVLFLCDRILEIANGDVMMKIRKGSTLVKLGRHSEAAEIAAEVMTLDSHNVDAHVIRALCHYQLDNMDKSLSFLRGALQRSPDANEPKLLYKKVKQVKECKESAAEFYRQGKNDDAKALYLDCVRLVTSDDDLKNTNLEAKFCFNLSLILYKQRMYEDSLQYASKAIDINPSYYKALVHRGGVHNSKEMYEEAARDFEAAIKIDSSKRGELAEAISTAKMAAKRAKRKDYYKILDIPKSATDDEIRKAYKKRALLHHPDRHAGATEAAQKEQEKNFKEVGEAYEVLSDPKKRIRYDQGHDLQDLGNSGGGSYYDPYDANQLFNMFFASGTSGMGGHAHAGRGGGGPRYYNSSGGGGRGGGYSYGFHR